MCERRTFVSPTAVSARLTLLDSPLYSGLKTMLIADPGLNKDKTNSLALSTTEPTASWLSLKDVRPRLLSLQVGAPPVRRTKADGF